jgi:hypothetical protein
MERIILTPQLSSIHADHHIPFLFLIKGQSKLLCNPSTVFCTCAFYESLG